MAAVKVWKDEAGNVIPANRITKSEKIREKHAEQILKDAKKASEFLRLLKEKVNHATEEVMATVAEENKIDMTKRKGNFTWFNFDRSVKIEISINERIVFDDMLIAACKEKLMSFIDTTVSGTEEFVKDLILDAFNTAQGRLDTRKVMSLLKYQKRIKNNLFQEAMDLLTNAIRRPDSKTYSRVWIKNAKGEYENIDLNYSSL